MCLAVAIDRLGIEGPLTFERERHGAILAQRHHAIETRAPAGVAGTGTLLLDLDPDRILIAIDAHLDDALGMAGFLALAPELLARAAVVPGVAGRNGLSKRLRIHMRDHQHLARLRICRDAGDKPAGVELRRQGAPGLDLLRRAGRSKCRWVSHKRLSRKGSML